MWFSETKIQKTLQPLPSFSPCPTTHSVYFSHTFTEQLYVYNLQVYFHFFLKQVKNVLTHCCTLCNGIYIMLWFLSSSEKENSEMSEILICVPVSPLPTPNTLDLSADCNGFLNSLLPIWLIQGHQ